MYKLDDLFDFDGDGELDSVERMEMYQFMDNPANRDRNRFFEDDEGLNLFEDPEDEEDEFEDDDEQDPCAAVSAAKYVPQTHSLPPPFNGYIPYYAASGEWLQHGAVKMRSLWIRHKPAKTAGRRRPPPPVAADGG